MITRGFRAGPGVAVLAALVLAVTASSALGAELIDRVVLDRTSQISVPPMPTGLSLKAGTVIDIGSGQVLWSSHAREVRPIASTTKIMTALVAINRAEPGERLKATRYVAGAGESMLGLRAGERMTVEDLLKALLLVSANDAADTFAARLAGSRSGFVSAMNRRARALGLSDTTYGNPVGLDQPKTVSSARDLAVLARSAMGVDRFRRIVGLSGATLRSGSRTRRIVNRNDLVGRHAYVDGVKTGHTIAAGFVLVGAAHKLDRGVISVAMGAPSVNARNSDTLKLLRFGRAFFRPVRPASPGRAIAKLPVALQDVSIAVYPRRTVAFAVRDRERYTTTVRAPRELEGPIKAGTRIGTVTIKRDGRRFAQVALELKTAVPAPPTSAVLLRQLGRMLPWLAILAIPFMMGTMVLRRRQRRGTGATGLSGRHGAPGPLVDRPEEAPVSPPR